jgi:hypothetical protein
MPISARLDVGGDGIIAITAVITLIALQNNSVLPAILGNHTATSAIGSGSKKVAKKNVTPLQKSILPSVKLFRTPTAK